MSTEQATVTTVVDENDHRRVGAREVLAIVRRAAPHPAGVDQLGGLSVARAPTVRRVPVRKCDSGDVQPRVLVRQRCADVADRRRSRAQSTWQFTDTRPVGRPLGINAEEEPFAIEAVGVDVEQTVVVEADSTFVVEDEQMPGLPGVSEPRLVLAAVGGAVDRRPRQRRPRRPCAAHSPTLAAEQRGEVVA